MNSKIANMVANKAVVDWERSRGSDLSAVFPHIDAAIKRSLTEDDMLTLNMLLNGLTRLQIGDE